MERIFSRAFDSLQEAWKTVIDMKPRLEGLETNPQFHADRVAERDDRAHFAEHQNRRYDGDDQPVHPACRHRADHAPAVGASLVRVAEEDRGRPKKSKR